ncbi:small acid-soluble spore protein H (minor) [Alkalibacillus filiformis]|uniref:Small, acid-soluble spore protein H n=1 Tax=Alkalibacillus filiformis TaxID=200990 RepID=A0ABU0DSX8_9BACI|nr:H-type small acid-soluble spore protein [Alkalibacillus filiformis]MDQ0351455.1 small acid-soluble spore protein H (minor) [Alkalibacillus filiformis]
MDEQRAKQIIDSLVMVNVKYHGIPVYIQEVNNSETATIFPLDEMHHEQEVELKGLYEDDPT